MQDITLGQAGLYALLGYAIVFFGLILLMIVMVILGKSFSAKSRKPVSIPEAAPVPVAAATAAPGSAGKLKLNNVDPKTAAMAMAIIADKLQKPLNELRFISIKEVSE